MYSQSCCPGRASHGDIETSQTDISLTFRWKKCFENKDEVKSSSFLSNKTFLLYGGDTKVLQPLSVMNMMKQDNFTGRLFLAF